jgi:segregation and condensation protein A
MNHFDNDESTEVVGTSPIKVTLPAFDGPLDLLLHLIKRDEVNIYDIPIAHVTEQYLAYIGMMSLLDLDVAGEFLVMAATLMRIKARMLLPPAPGQSEDDEEFVDPRDELVRQLLEYRRFKEAAGQLQSAEEFRRQGFERGYIPPIGGDEPPELAPISLFTLLDVLKDVVSRVGEEFFHEVVLEEVSLEEKIALVESELVASGRVLFRDLLIRFPRRMHAVVTLMAILELSRLGRIAVRQEGLFSEIWIYHADEAPPDPMLAGLERVDDAAAVGEAPGPEEPSNGTT